MGINVPIHTGAAEMLAKIWYEYDILKVKKVNEGIMPAWEPWKHKSDAIMYHGSILY
jgi:hypothetical protein